MTWGGNSVVQVLIIQGNQAISGLFLYNGIGGPGNPPQFAAVASSVTQDPFGNAIGLSKILIQGNVITESGGIFRTAAAAPLIQIDGPHNAVLLYNAASALTETVASITTSDGLGNTVQQGFTAYGSVNTTYAQLLGAALQFHVSGDTGNPNISEATGAVLNLNSGTVAGAGTQCILTLNPAASIPFAILSGTLQMLETVAPAAATVPTVFANTSGHVGVVSGSTHGDSNDYDTERLTLICAATTINSNTVRVNVFSHALGKGTYKIRIWMVTQNTTAADAAAWSFAATGGLVIGAGSLVDFESKTGVAPAAAAVQYLASSTVTTTFNGQGQANNQQLIVQATVVVTTAGTLTFGGLELVAGNTVTVSAGGQMDIYPVVAT